jgi:hypothetical protein
LLLYLIELHLDVATNLDVGSNKSYINFELKKKKGKIKFFDLSSRDLYNKNMNLYSNNRVLPIFKGKYIFKWEKLVKTVLWIIFAILIKSICQFVLGAEETSIEKLLLGLDCTFYLKYILGGSFMALLPDI